MIPGGAWASTEPEAACPWIKYLATMEAGGGTWGWFHTHAQARAKEDSSQVSKGGLGSAMNS